MVGEQQARLGRLSIKGGGALIQHIGCGDLAGAEIELKCWRESMSTLLSSGLPGRGKQARLAVARRRERPSVQEPAAERTISGVPTSVTAFVGRALRGPIDEPVGVTSSVDFERIFGGLWPGSHLGYSVRDFFRLGGSAATIVRVHQQAPDDIASIVLGAAATQLTLEAASPGAWGSQLSAVIDDDAVNPNDSTLFNLTVVDDATHKVEIYREVSIAPGSRRRVDAIVEQQSALVRIPGTLPSALGSLPQRVVATNGNDGIALSAISYTTGANLSADGRGLYALDRADPINLIVIPPYTGRGDVEDQVIADTIEYATRRGAIVIMDPPSAWTSPAEAIDGAAAPSIPVSSHAALYYPRIRQPDPIRDDELVTFAPSGAVAGVIARTDILRGVWKAPAGVAASLDDVVELSVQLTADDIGELSRLGVNCLNAIPGAGHVVWGSRTREGAEQLDSEWKYLQVRRTALFIESSLQRGTRWAASEPNDDETRSQIRRSVEAFMDSMFRQGAFAGATPEEAYFVKCGAETTSQQDMVDGIVNITVGFAPLKPAEFVVLKVRQKAGHAPRSRWRRSRRRRPSPS